MRRQNQLLRVERLQHIDRLVRPARRDEEVIMKIRGDGVHADPVLRELRRNCRQETDRLQTGMNFQSDHSAYQSEVESVFVRFGSCENQG